MSYRFTNTEKWSDSWFSNLKQIEMLLFIYLCDNCDIAGFIEINVKRWAADLGSSITVIEGALKGLQRGFILSKDSDCIYLKNYLKHQKNLPLNSENKAHIGIIRRFDIYRYKFDIQDINQFIEGASKGLQSPSGIGNGTGTGKVTGVQGENLEIPDYSEFELYAIEKLPTVNREKLKLKYLAWKEANWYDGHGKKIKNWKSKLLNTLQYIGTNGNTIKSKTELFAESTRWAYELDAINAAKIMEQSDHENSYDLGSG